MKRLINNFNQAWQYESSIKEDFKIELNDDSYVLYIKNTCYWFETTGGCTMCNYTSKDGIHINDILSRRFNDIITELVLLRKNFTKIKFNFNGSFFSEKELDIDVAVEFINCLKRELNIDYISLETRVEYVDSNKLAYLIQKTGIRYELCFGIESINEEIQVKCFNKGRVLNNFYNLIEEIQGMCEIKVYLLIKPPFISEIESIEDVVDSVKTLVSKGITKISYAPVDIQKNTLIEFLLQEYLYRPVWIWSIIEINSRLKYILKKYENVHLASLEHFPKPLASAFNCEKCTEHLLKRLEANRRLTWDDLGEDETCSCIERWKKELDVRQFNDIDNTISETNKCLEKIISKAKLLRQKFQVKENGKLVKDPAKEVPVLKTAIDCVGIKQYKIPLKIDKFNDTVCIAELMVDLDEFHRGIHMSRLIELLNEFSKTIHYDIIRDIKNFLHDVKKKTNSTKVCLNFSTTLFERGETPIMQKEDIQNISIKISTMCENSCFSIKCIFAIPIINACPCTLVTSRELLEETFTHTQRGCLSIEYINTNLYFEDMLSITNSFRNIYSLLKREDELYVVKSVFDKPRFCEDICREVSEKLLKMERIQTGKINIKVETEESIHDHSAVAFKTIYFS